MFFGLFFSPVWKYVSRCRIFVNVSVLLCPIVHRLLVVLVKRLLTLIRNSRRIQQYEYLQKYATLPADISKMANPRSHTKGSLKFHAWNFPSSFALLAKEQSRQSLADWFQPSPTSGFYNQRKRACHNFYLLFTHNIAFSIPNNFWTEIIRIRIFFLK